MDCIVKLSNVLSSRLNRFADVIFVTFVTFYPTGPRSVSGADLLGLCLDVSADGSLESLGGRAIGRCEGPGDAPDPLYRLSVFHQ